ncbi:C-type lectin domain family 4 member E [Austrofundulus limnaeus]|uniref:C-type lectin domain family 4 member E n=1 Tax=Austrofundulus limnaeus TaxID=52670 RepID=A0A2I4CHQ9_AUSLI|nr:PREDICTED: C-type lectin domain family 4 member E-like [Austrofundulus limnaeus]
MHLICEEGWEEHGGKSYKFLTSKASWEDSRSFCRDLGGDLVKIDSREEQEFLLERIKSKINDDEHVFWIGLTDSETEGTWLWVDGSPLDESFWIGGEPNNGVGLFGLRENCVALKRLELQSWNDQPCSSPARRICEISL